MRLVLLPSSCMGGRRLPRARAAVGDDAPGSTAARGPCRARQDPPDGRGRDTASAHAFLARAVLREAPNQRAARGFWCPAAREVRRGLGSLLLLLLLLLALCCKAPRVRQYGLCVAAWARLRSMGGRLAAQLEGSSRL